MKEEAILKRFLVKPNDRGEFDTFLYDWAVKTPEQAKKEIEERKKREKKKKRKAAFYDRDHLSVKLVFNITQVRGDLPREAQPSPSGEYNAMIDLLGVRCECPHFRRIERTQAEYRR